MKEKVLKLLKEYRGFISGQELCESLNVSRTAIWKIMNNLKSEGYHIEAVQNKGYKLVSCPDTLVPEEIRSMIKTSWFGSDISYYDTIDSTNNEVKRQAENGAKQGLLVIAEEQTLGRGRRGRNWTSPKGQGIWMSFLIKPDILPTDASMLTLVAALAMTSALRDVANINAEIKWPNDIVANGKKLCGILTEMSTETDAVNYVVVGVGVNVNTDGFPEDIAATASSVFLETGEKVSRSRIVAEFGQNFERYYKIFLQNCDLSELVDEYNSYLVNTGREIYVIEGQNKTVMRALGINERGELLAIAEDGTVKSIIAGEVSVRGIYGYV